MPGGRTEDGALPVGMALGDGVGGVVKALGLGMGGQDDVGVGDGSGGGYGLEHWSGGWP